MDDPVADVLERLSASGSARLVRLIHEARLDEPAEAEPDPAGVVHRYRWLMERAAAGVRLTQAGHLPPAVVSEAIAQLYPDHWWGKGNREVHTPMLYLRESARRFGLVRSYRGKLVLTKLGGKLIDDPTALWWHLAGSLPDARSDFERQAGILYLLVVAAGRLRQEEVLIAEGMAVLGWVDSRTREPMSPFAATMAAHDTASAFHRLDVLADRLPGEAPVVSPPAAVRLARAALLRQPASTPLRRSTPGPSVELTITLREIEPPIWRRVVVASSLTLRELHAVIQTAMGWEDRHLYGFDVDGVLYTTLEDLDVELVGDLDSFTVGQAADAATMFIYEYDYGDDWDHVIRVEEVHPSGVADSPRVLDGARACPPEDCGGFSGYSQLLEALADEKHPRHADVLRWLGRAYDPEAFDLAATNARLARVARTTRRGRR